MKVEEQLSALEGRMTRDRGLALEVQRAELQALIVKANVEKDEYLVLYSKENKLRKSIHNKLLELQGNIR